MFVTMEKIRRICGEKIRITSEWGFEADDPGADGEWGSTNGMVEGNFLFYRTHVVVWAYIYADGKSIDEDTATASMETLSYKGLTAEKLIRKAKKMAIARLKNIICDVVTAN